MNAPRVAVSAVLAGLLLMAGQAAGQAGPEVSVAARPEAVSTASGLVYPAAFWPRRACPCPSPQATAEPAATEPATQPQATQPQAEAEVVPPSALASAVGATAGPSSAAPYMIGDFFGAGDMRFTGLGATNASVGLSGGDRRFKIVESNSPVPTDRVFFNYNFFANPLVNMQNGTSDLNRYSFGVEKTFFSGQNSLEFRLPFTSGYNSDQSRAGDIPVSAAEFGDIAIALKQVLVRNDHLLVSTGLGMVFPTGSDWRAYDDTGELRVVTRNEAIHLQPFLGASWQPNDRLFFLFFTQADFDAHGNSVLMSAGGQGTPSPLEAVGVLQEQSLLFFDISGGYWIYRNPCRRLITGVAPVIELHYSTTMQNADAFSGPAGTIGGNPELGVGFNRRDVLNLTTGLHFEIGALSTLTVAGVVPLRTEDDRDFDAEFAVQFNRRF